MTVKEIKEIAKEQGVNPGKMKKGEIIKAIQQAEGNEVCFGTNPQDCGQEKCLWREDCLKLS